MFASFYEAVSYLFTTYSRSKPYRTQGLDKDTRTPFYTRKLLDAVGSPDRAVPNLLVTGSKGKGSTARILAALLQSQGLRVGLFTSPHLVDFTERIRVDGQTIAESDFMRLLASIHGEAEAISKEFLPHEYFGPVGLMAVVACLFFRERQTDVNVIELGRGARFDDVNQLTADLAVITPVMFEHADYLGPGLADIAWNKAGIIRPGMRCVISGVQTAVVRDVIAMEAQANDIPLYFLGRDFAVLDTAVKQDHTVCSIKSLHDQFTAVSLTLLGRCQADNAAVALAAAECYMGAALHREEAVRALEHVFFAGRCQVIGNAPKVIVDGAIHRDSAIYVAEVIAQMKCARVVAVIGVPADKDYRGVIETMGALSSDMFITKAQNPHLQFPEDALLCARQWTNALEIARVDDAITAALKLAGDNGLVAVVGTQSVVAETLAYFAVST